MTPRYTRVITVAATIAAVGIISSQGRGNPTEWPTADGDAQHTSWIRNDVSISPETMSQPGFELQWKTTLESPVRHGVSLGAGVVASGVNIFTPLSIIGAPSNQVFAVDNDTGNLFWTRRFDGTLAAGTAACPGGISGTLTRMVNLTTPAPGAGRGGGRGRGSLQQRRRRAGRWRADSRARRRRSRERPAASNTSGCAGNDTATPGRRAGLSAAVNTSARSNPSVTVPDERGRTRLRRAVAPIRGRLRSERRWNVPNARVGVG